VAAAVPDTVRVANMIEAGKTPLLTPKELHDLGYDLIVSPLTGLFAATRAMATAYQTLREQGSLRDHLDLVVTFDDFNRVVDLDRHYRLEGQYVEEGSDTSSSP
jgi:methylisocitrate lyase